jgi:hypothetical protein
MGIRDREYMKKPSDDDGRQSSSTDSKLEEFLSGFLARHPRFFLYVSIGLVVLVIAALIIAKVSGGSQ